MSRVLAITYPTYFKKERKEEAQGQETQNIYPGATYMRNTNTIARDRMWDIDLCIICAY